MTGISGKKVTPFRFVICLKGGVRISQICFELRVRNCKVNVFKQQQLARENLSTSRLFYVTVLFAKEVVQAQ